MAGVLFWGFLFGRPCASALAMDADPQPPRWTLDGFRAGAMATVPLLPGLCAFAIAFGTVAARKGFSLLDACLMSATVFSGVAQIIVVDAWPNELTAATIFASALITALICSRFILIGASMRPWFGALPERGLVYLTLYLLVEPPWLLGTRYYNNGGRDPAFVLGSCVVCWLSWVIPTIPGYWLGASIGDPQRFGIDLIMPAFFVIMLLSMWQGPRRAISWIVGSVVAVVVAQLFGGFWYVLAGALAGSVVGGFVDD
jgi:4-azaleucine resistance transporter AzlC